MKKRTVGLNILLWSEVIIAIRTLLFAVPVLINKYMNQSFSFQGANNQFILLITAMAVLYLFVGLSSMVGRWPWKAFHYVAFVLILILTKIWGGQSESFIKFICSFYFLPVCLAVIYTAIVMIIKGTK